MPRRIEPCRRVDGDVNLIEDNGGCSTWLQPRGDGTPELVCTSDNPPTAEELCLMHKMWREINRDDEPTTNQGENHV